MHQNTCSDACKEQLGSDTVSCHYISIRRVMKQVRTLSVIPHHYFLMDLLCSWLRVTVDDFVSTLAPQLLLLPFVFELVYL
jgi:hypothetical protein